MPAWYQAAACTSILPLLPFVWLHSHERALDGVADGLHDVRTARCHEDDEESVDFFAPRSCNSETDGGSASWICCSRCACLWMNWFHHLWMANQWFVVASTSYSLYFYCITASVSRRTTKIILKCFVFWRTVPSTYVGTNGFSLWVLGTWYPQWMAIFTYVCRLYQSLKTKYTNVFFADLLQKIFILDFCSNHK